MIKPGFITFEGGEGAGKTTLVERLSLWMGDHRVPCIKTREPGGHPNAEAIRHLILQKRCDRHETMTDFLLMAAARSEHLAKTVHPALEAHQVVLCDRFIDSSLVYQGYLGGIDIETLLQMHAITTHNCMPELTFFLDVDEKLAWTRVHSRSATMHEAPSRWDNETIDVYRTIRGGFLKIAQRFSERIVTIDANQNADNVFNDCLHTLIKRLPWLRQFLEFHQVGKSDES